MGIPLKQSASKKQEVKPTPYNPFNKKMSLDPKSAKINVPKVTDKALELKKKSKSDSKKLNQAKLTPFLKRLSEQ